MKLFKRVSLGLFIFLSTTSFLLWILAKNTNPDTIKNMLNNKLSAITNKQSAINGSITWHLFPIPGIKITEISIGNQDKQEDYFLSINKLLLNLKIRPLFSGKLVFDNVNVDGVSMRINTDAIPAASVNFLPQKPANESTAMQLLIDRFLLTHGQIEVYNQDKKILVKNLKLGLEQFNFHNAAFPVQFKASLSSQSASNTLKTQINYNGHLSLSANTFKNRNSIPLIEGQIQLKNTKLNTLMIDHVNTTISTANKQLRFMPLTLSLYKGESIGDMYYDFTDKKFKLNQTATNLDGQSFMKDFFGQKSMQGNLDYSIQAELPLNNPDLENLSGKGNFTLKDGVIKKVNVGLFIEDLKNTLPKLMKGDNNLAKADQFDMNKYHAGETPFNLINIQYQLHQAQLVTESFILQTNNLQITGGGNVDLKNQNIQSHMLLTLAASQESGFQNIHQLPGGGFPITLEGTLAKPLLSADIKLLNAALMTLPLKAIKKTIPAVKKNLIAANN